jgi:hypothetical protein
MDGFPYSSRVCGSRELSLIRVLRHACGLVSNNEVMRNAHGLVSNNEVMRHAHGLQSSNLIWGVNNSGVWRGGI